ncbi:hypothetical protein AAHC03_01117 [Spirometra sp. Aus1]
MEKMFHNESSVVTVKRRFFDRTQREGKILMNFYIGLNTFHSAPFPPHGDEDLKFFRMMSGIRNRGVVLIFTSSPPANVKDALDLNVVRGTQFPFTQEPQAARIQLRGVPHPS